MKNRIIHDVLFIFLGLTISLAVAKDVIEMQELPNDETNVVQTLPNHLTLKEKEEGYTLLFDGKELSRDLWQGSVKNYKVEGDAIVCKPGGDILTKKEYADFIFRFEFKLPPGGNNGVGIRTKLHGSLSHEDGMELQILDHFDPKYKGLKEWQFHGSLYGVAPAKRNAEKNDYLKPVGEWNSEEVIVQGTKIKVVLNGETILDIDTNDYKDKPKLDEKPHKGIEREKGFVGFLGHGDPVAFRNIRIKELPKSETAK